MGEGLTDRAGIELIDQKKEEGLQTAPELNWTKQRGGIADHVRIKLDHDKDEGGNEMKWWIHKSWRRMNKRNQEVTVKERRVMR